MAGRLLRTAEVAERLGVEQATVARYIREGRLPAIATAGGHYRVAEADVIAFLGTDGLLKTAGPSIVAVANQKGGVGKSTTAVNLGAELADQGRRVLIIDCDPQASASAALGFDLTSSYTSLYDLMHAATTAHPRALQTAVRRFPHGEDLIPAHIDLAVLETELVSVMRREYVLSDLLAPVCDQYDVVLLDCPPSLGWITINALTAATDVLIPVVPEYLAAQGLGRLLDTVTLVRDKRLNPGLTVAGVILTMVKNQTTHHQQMREQIRAFCAQQNIAFLPVEIPASIRAADAAGAGVPLTRYGGNNEAKAAYQDLAALLFPPIPRREANHG